MKKLDKHAWRFPLPGEKTPALGKAYYGEEPMICQDCNAWGMAPGRGKPIYSLEYQSCEDRVAQQVHDS